MDEIIIDSYEDAFNKSLKFVKFFSKVYKINYCDLYSNWYDDFQFKLKIKYLDIDCYKFSKKRIQWLAIKIKKEMIKQMSLSHYLEVLDFGYQQNFEIEYEVPYGEIGLTEREKIYCEKLLQGYNQNEIKEFSPYILKNLRKKLAKFYNINNYHNYVHHKEKVSEKKLKQLEKARAVGRSEKCGRAKKKVGIYKDNKLEKVFNSCADASRYITNGKSNTVVTTNIHRNTKYKGYEFRYLESEKDD